MIAAIRTGIGSLVDQWFRGPRARMAPPVINDRQGSRAMPRPKGHTAVASATAHADVAMQRFMAQALDANLADLRQAASKRELAELEPATRVLQDL